jgi:hypothetical protein
MRDSRLLAALVGVCLHSLSAWAQETVTLAFPPTAGDSTITRHQSQGR